MTIINVMYKIFLLLVMIFGVAFFASTPALSAQSDVCSDDIDKSIQQGINCFADEIEGSSLDDFLNFAAVAIGLLGVFYLTRDIIKNYLGGGEGKKGFMNIFFPKPAVLMLGAVFLYNLKILTGLIGNIITWGDGVVTTLVSLLPFG